MFRRSFTDNDCVNLMLLGDQMYAMSETTKKNMVDLDTLERTEQVCTGGQLRAHRAGQYWWTAKSAQSRSVLVDTLERTEQVSTGGQLRAHKAGQYWTMAAYVL